MSGSGALGPEAAVDLLSATTGRQFRLVGRLAGGESGAYEVEGGLGGRRVVKWSTDSASQVARRAAVQLTDRLHEVARWPVPAQAVVEAPGCLFVLQEFMAGAPVTHLTHGMIDTLLTLHERRLGLARPDDPDGWASHLIGTLVVGGQGYCIHDSLRTYDGRTAALLERIIAVGSRLDASDLGGDDLVHWDLHPGNLLERGEELSAIVDCDHVKAGDAAFDLVSLAVSSLASPCEDGLRQRLFEDAVVTLPPARRLAYVGHLLLRYLDWPIRRGRADEVDLWLSQADRLMGW